MKRRIVAGVLVGGLVAGPVTAQVEEILVTTRKIEENLKDVPLAITAFSEAEIQAAGIASLSDVADFTPGLQFFNPLGETLPVPFIRGIAPTDIRDSENNAAIFVDGVYVSGREGLNFSQLDVERIEVVKGPQSALYGRTAFSGAINYVTKRPTDIFEATAETTIGNRGKLLGKASVSGPLIPGLLSGRVAALYDDWDGSYDNPVSNVDVGGYEYKTLQGSLLFTPTDDLTAYLSAYVSSDKIDDSATTTVSTNCEDTALYNTRLQFDDGTPAGSNLGNFCGKVPKLTDDNIPKIGGANGEDRDVIRLSLNVDWELDYGTLSFLTGYSDTDQEAVLDFGRGLGYDVPFVYCNGLEIYPLCLTGDPLQAFFAGVLNFEGGVETREISQEIRFTSPQDQDVRWSAGVYAFRATTTDYVGNSRIVYSADDSPFVQGLPPADLALFCPCLPLTPNSILAPFGSFIFGPSFEPVGTPVGTVLPDGSISTGFLDTGFKLQEAEDESISFFASVDWDFLERFTARLEGRYTRDPKELTQRIQQDLDGDGRLDEQTEKNTWGRITARATLDFKVNDDWMLYGSIANGTKPGAFDGDVAPAVFRDANGNGTPEEGEVQDELIILRVDPEKILTTELGIKGTTADGRLGLDVAIYYSDWRDIVVPQVFTETPGEGLPINGVPPALNINAGKATVQGFEIGGNIRWTDQWSSRFGVSFTDAVWDRGKVSTLQYFPSFRAPGCQGPPVDLDPDARLACDLASGDITGKQLSRVSPWTASANLSYRTEIFGDWDFFGRVDGIWQDEWFVGNDNQGVIPDHTYVNLRLGLDSARYTLELFANNLFEDTNPVGAFRDIYWSNTQDVRAAGPDFPTSTLADFPPLRLSISQPRLRTFGLNARVRFGGAVR